MVADLEAIVDAAGLERFTLLGVSQSCAVSVAYAARHPERITGLILYGGYAKGWRARGGDPVLLAQNEALTSLIRDGWGQDKPILRQIFTAQMLPGATPEQMAWYNELQRRTVHPEEAARFNDVFGDIDVSDLLERVTAPTLVIHARRDLAVPFQAGVELARGISGAEFVELDSSNHVLLAEEPDFARFVDAVRSFVARTGNAAAQPVTGPTRKQITGLCVEIISPLQSLADASLEQTMQVLDPMIDLARETAERHGGRVVASNEFSLTAIWGAPVAIEDHALRACRAALALKSSIEAASGGQVRVRIGLDTGEAIIRPDRNEGRGRFEAVSNVVRRAGQLAAALRRPAVAVTCATRELAGGAMKVEKLDGALASSPGLGERVYELLAENRALCRWHLRSGQGLTRLVGRATELAMLSECWQRAREGQGQLVGIVADPGVGKSRLSHEFLASKALRNSTVLECGALEFDSNVALQLIRTMLQSLFGVDEATEPPEAAATVSRSLRKLGAGADLEPALRFALKLPENDERWMSLDAPDRIAAVGEAVRAVLQLECRRRPVALLVEDLHWTDAESEGILNQVIDGMSAQRLLVIATYRPEYVHGWSQKSLFRQVRLGILSTQETDAFLGTLIGSDPSVAHLRPLLSEKSDGTPLFLEEMVRMLAETGRLVGEPGAFRAPEAIGELQIPPSVKPVIAARIDRLREDDRRVLQIAAVIGKDVPKPILRALSGLDETAFGAALSRLNETEFLFELQSYPEVEYTFKHALTHDVAYESLLTEDRRRLHASALRLMQRLYDGQADLQAERLADHALKAEAWSEAADYLLAATDRALDLAAYSKAAHFLDHAARAVDMLEPTPERIAQAIDIRCRLRPALEGIGRFRDALRRLDEAEALAGELGDATRLQHVVLHKSYAYSTHGQVEQAVVDADRLKVLAIASGDERYAAEADLAAAQGLIFRHRAGEVAERLAPHDASFTGPWRMARFGLLGTRSVFYLGYTLMSAALCGDLARARAAAVAMNDVVRESGRPIDRYAGATHEAVLHIVAGPTQAYEQELAAVAEECRVRAPLPFLSVLLSRLGHVRLLCRGPDEACETLNEAMRLATETDMPHMYNYASVIHACAESQANGPEALPSLERALVLARSWEDPWMEVLALRSLADVTPPAEGLSTLDRAEAVAVAQGFRPELARIAVARAELLETTDSTAAGEVLGKARMLFAEIGLEFDACVVAA